jgi:hypothetical protein
LIGNTFPWSLIRRPVHVVPTSLDVWRSALAGKVVHSFWGHASTLAAVNVCVGVDLTPPTARPTLLCDPISLLPSLNGVLFTECWVVSPEFEAGFRPATGAEVPLEKINGWQVLRINWNDQP